MSSFLIVYMEGKMDAIERISELKRSIMTLEWDKQRNQINFGKTQQLEDYKKELVELEAKIKDLPPEDEEDKDAKQEVDAKSE